MASSMRNILLALFFIMLAVSDLTTGASEKTETRSRRRRPFPGSADSDEASMTTLSRPWTPLAHRRHHHGKSFHHAKEIPGMKWSYSDAEIEESCKNEPGCEWICNEPYECVCRCQLTDEPAQFVPKPLRLIPRH